jgi:DNA-binding MarR family transcriptional regulator
MAKRSRQRLDRAVLAEALRVCACTNFRKAARVVTRLFDETLEPCGLRGTQLALLLQLSLEDKTTVPRLARTMVTEESTVARNIQPLIRRGFVTTHREPGRRTQTLTLTSQGWAALERAVPLWKSAQTAFENLIGSNQWPRVLADLAQVAQSKQ